jgi:hypothetical protein
MKKKAWIGSIALICVALFLVGFGSRAEMLTPKDAPAHKGKWVGRTTFGSFGSAQAGDDTVTEIEIYNDTLPLEGKITFLVLPRRVWADLPSSIQGGPTGQGAVVQFKKAG